MRFCKRYMGDGSFGGTEIAMGGDAASRGHARRALSTGGRSTWTGSARDCNVHEGMRFARLRSASGLAR